MNIFCLFCATGKEHSVVKFINDNSDWLTAIAPSKIVQIKRNKIWIKENKILMPGYIFLYTEEKNYIPVFNNIKYIYRLLSYSDRMYSLSGIDKEYAMWLYNNNGIIDVSDVMIKGNTVKVLKGALKDMIGRIIWVNKKKRSAVVEIEFNGILRKITFPVNILESISCI